jgi:hypothetical protein
MKQPNPTKYLEKSLQKGIIYPSVIASNFVESYSPKQVAIKVNKSLNGSYVNYSEIKSVYKKIEKEQKLIEHSESSSIKKKEYALKSIVANSIVESLIKKNPSTKAIWLASNSQNPSLEHMANYGEEFYLDEGINGEIPGNRPNCQCGMKIID